MQILLIGDDDSPQRKFIASILDFHPRVQATYFSLSTEISSITQHFADCIVYVARMPNQFLIDKLDKNCPLVLVADIDYRSQLFIQFDDLVTDFAKAFRIFVDNIDSLALLHDVENERSFFPLVVPEPATQIFDQPPNTKDGYIFEKLSDDYKQFLFLVCDGVSQGHRHERIYQALNMSKANYYRTLHFLQPKFGALTNSDLIEKVMPLVKQCISNLRLSKKQQESYSQLIRSERNSGGLSQLANHSRASGSD
jgi:hypothetical protein